MSVVFAVTLAVEIALGVLLAWSIARPEAAVWPPPPQRGRRSWQYRLVWALIDLATLGIVAVGVLDWNTFVLDHWLRLPLGAALALGGGAFALWGIAHLSWHPSLGLEAELVRSGPYRWTRNPQYVGDIALLAGWGIFCNSLATWGYSACWVSPGSRWPRGPRSPGSGSATARPTTTTGARCRASWGCRHGDPTDGSRLPDRARRGGREPTMASWG